LRTTGLYQSALLCQKDFTTTGQLTTRWIEAVIWMILSHSYPRFVWRCG